MTGCVPGSSGPPTCYGRPLFPIANLSLRRSVLYWVRLMTASLYNPIASRTAEAPRPPFRSVVTCSLSLALALMCVFGVAAQAPPTIDTSAIGPQVGDTVPGFSGTDQFGKRHTLESSLGPKGAMLVFFRSADW